MKTTVREVRAQRVAPVTVEPLSNPPSNSDEWLIALGLSGKAVLTIDETAALLRVSERTVRERIRVGDVPALHIGRRVVIPVPALVLLLLGQATNTE